MSLSSIGQELPSKSMILSNAPEPFFCMFPGANLPGERCCLGFKASVVVEQGIIHFLQDVPLEEVSNTSLVCPRPFLRGPLTRVTNTYLRCMHEVQLVSRPSMALYLRVADFVFTDGGRGEQWCRKDVFHGESQT
jgi:hypothetical protein